MATKLRSSVMPDESKTALRNSFTRDQSKIVVNSTDNATSKPAKTPHKPMDRRSAERFLYNHPNADSQSHASSPNARTQKTRVSILCSKVSLRKGLSPCRTETHFFARRRNGSLTTDLYNSQAAIIQLAPMIRYSPYPITGM